MIKIDLDDFEQWRANPVTELLMAALGKEAERAKRAWVTVSWEGSRIDAANLSALQERANFARQLQAMDAATLEAMTNAEDE